MFDVIGKRRWFYLFSLIITIPGLVFILLTPFTDAGLQFTIDYTGGTQVGDPLRGPDGHARPGRGGLRRSRASRRSRSRPAAGFIEIKTEPTGPPGADAVAERQPRRRADRRARAGRPARAASAAPSASRRPERAAPPPSASASPAVAVAVGLARAHRPPPARRPLPPGRRPPAAPTGNTRIPTEGKLGEVAVALEAGARTDRGAAQPDDHRRGRQLRPHQPGARS